MKKKKIELDVAEFYDLDDDIAEPRAKSTGHEAPREHAVDRCKSVRIGRILDPEPDRELDHALVSGIVESARTIGLLHPIAVREQKIERKGKLRTRTILVAGAHRLEAARSLGYERIDCVYIDFDDDTSVKLVHIGEDLFRKHLTVLRRAELLAQWYELGAKDLIYGQVDRKNKRGRPPSGTSRIARDIFGITVDAWRKKLKRAKQIARIQPEAKQAAIDAGLDDNQNALFAIGAAKGRKAQLRKVAKLAQTSGEAHEPVAKTVDDGDAARSDKPGSDKLDSETIESEKPDEDREQGVQSNPPETSFEQLETLWNKHLRKPWKHTGFVERERFIAMLRRTRNDTGTDAAEFVKTAFQGREKIYAKHLYALAKSRCVSKKTVKMVLLGMGYHRKRDGYGRSGRYYYSNTNPNWKAELEAISESELMGEGQKDSHATHSNWKNL